MGNMIESRNERSASTRTSIDCGDVASPSSGNVGEDGLLVLGVRDRDCISLSVLSGWNTCEKLSAKKLLTGKWFSYAFNIWNNSMPEEFPNVSQTWEQLFVVQLG